VQVTSRQPIKSTGEAIQAPLPRPLFTNKPVTIRRERVGRRIGSLDERDIARLNVALALVVELAD
jgi:mRNA interferase MazF